MNGAPIERDEPQPRKRHGVLFCLLLLLTVFGLVRLYRRRSGAGLEQASEVRWPETPEVPPRTSTPGPWADWSSTSGGTGSTPSAPEPPISEQPVSERRYAVKWTDRSVNSPIRRQERDLTFDQALEEVHRINRHRRALASGSAFSHLRVYLQCLCGRDVTDPTQPHTVPGTGKACQYVRPHEPSDTSGQPPSLHVVAA